MLICDTHADTLWAITAGKHQLDVTAQYLTATPDVRVQALALFVCTGGMMEQPTIVEKELQAFEGLKQQGFHQIRQLSEALPGRANVMLTIEGCEAFGGDIANVERFAHLGVMAAALTWNNENQLAHPAKSGSREGLKPFGKQAVAEMRRLGMAVDISHLNRRGADEVMDTDIPPMASHSCAYSLCHHFRNLTDEQLRRLFAMGGFVGVNFYPHFLSENGKADVNRVVDHMAYMCDLGGENSIGFGSDFDGIEVAPDGLQNAGDVPALMDTMRRRGFSEGLVEKIAGQNFADYLKRL